MIYNFNTLSPRQQGFLVRALVELDKVSHCGLEKVDSNTINISLVINEIEVDFFSFCDSLWGRLDAYLKDYAKEYVEERFKPQITFLNRMQDTINELIENGYED